MGQLSTCTPHGAWFKKYRILYPPLERSEEREKREKISTIKCKNKKKKKIRKFQTEKDERNNNYFSIYAPFLLFLFFHSLYFSKVNFILEFNLASLYDKKPISRERQREKGKLICVTRKERNYVYANLRREFNDRMIITNGSRPSTLFSIFFDDTELTALKLTNSSQNILLSSLFLFVLLVLFSWLITWDLIGSR